MHVSVYEFIRRCANQFTFPPGNGPVLDVGGLNVNGTARDHFAGYAYTSLDMREGSGVDVVADASAMPFPDASFRTVVTSSMLEHDRTPWLTAAEIARVTAPGGHLIVTAPGNGWPHHEYPDDIWRFSVPAFDSLFGQWYRWILLEEVNEGEGPDVRGFGVRL